MKVLPAKEDWMSGKVSAWKERVMVGGKDKEVVW